MKGKYKNRKGHGEGVIRLIHNDAVIQSEKYRWVGEQKKFLTLWGKLYGKAIRKAEISVIPNF